MHLLKRTDKKRSQQLTLSSKLLSKNLHIEKISTKPSFCEFFYPSIPYGGAQPWLIQALHTVLFFFFLKGKSQALHTYLLWSGIPPILTLIQPFSIIGFNHKNGALVKLLNLRALKVRIKGGLWLFHWSHIWTTSYPNGTKHIICTCKIDAFQVGNRSGTLFIKG